MKQANTQKDENNSHTIDNPPIIIGKNVSFGYNGEKNF